METIVPTRERATFVVCTKQRSIELERCLSSFVSQLSTDDELVVIENSSSFSSRDISLSYGARWLQEIKPGVAWARNRGYQEARNELVVYIDDDCVADRVWVKEILNSFAEKSTSVVTGSVLAREPELAIPYLIDREYPFHRGWLPATYKGTTGTIWSPFDVWRVGTGANMAWRKEALIGIGGFDPALGAGTPAGSCEDIDAFRRALQSGRTIHYQPSALVMHDHPRLMKDLQRMLTRYAITLGAHGAKATLEERQWKALLFLLRDWWWQISWATQLLFSRDVVAGLKMPPLAILSQPIASVWGMLLFFRYRNLVRKGQIKKVTSASIHGSVDSIPVRSNVVMSEIDLLSEYPDTVNVNTILLVRCAERPIFSVEVAAGTSIREAVTEQLNHTVVHWK